MARLPLPPLPVPDLPQDETSLLRLAAERAMPIDAMCLPGVVMNMALLARHAAIMAGSDEK